ncbi:unnamed protein product [Oikopleura dioica]|uniref:ABC transmembrane type-1 domain-containing protein n=1 Tax=Oikopleura dioica TaxID=34765 RepID=E4XRS8_OIKDI|nr:unnamed protein product [Oikopleura dioica]
MTKKEKTSKKKKDEKEPVKKVPYFKLYRFASKADWLLIAFGWLSAIIVGVSQPAMVIFFGNSVNDFTSAGKFQACFPGDAEALIKFANQTGSADDISDYCLLTLSTLTDREKDLFAGGSGASTSGTMMDNIWWFIGIGVIVWLAGWIQTATLMYSADRQVNFLRATYFS